MPSESYAKKPAGLVFDDLKMDVQYWLHSAPEHANCRSFTLFKVRGELIYGRYANGSRFEMTKMECGLAPTPLGVWYALRYITVEPD